MVWNRPGSVHAPDVVPASLQQRDVWLNQQLAPASAAYNVLFHYQVDAHVDAARLSAALTATVRRHAALRAGFSFNGTDVVQRIAPVADTFVAVGDVSDEAAAIAFAVTPFDLTTPPLVRACRYVIAGGATGIMLALHHLVLDGWSCGVLEFELQRALGDPATLGADDDVSYLEYCRVQHARATDAVAIAAERSYWDVLFELPDRFKPDPLAGSFGPRPAAEHRLPLEAAAVRGIFARAQAARVTPFTIVFDAFCRTLAKITGRSDVLAGVTIAGRTEPAYLNTIGLFARVVPFVYAGGTGVVDVQSQLWRTQARPVISWDVLFAGEPARARLASRWPWSITSVQAMPVPELGGATRRLPVPRLDSKAPMLLRVDFDDADVRPTFVYQRHLFDGAALDDIAVAFAAALDVTVAV